MRRYQTAKSRQSAAAEMCGAEAVESALPELPLHAATVGTAAAVSMAATGLGRPQPVP